MELLDNLRQESAADREPRLPIVLTRREIERPPRRNVLDWSQSSGLRISTP